MLRTPNLKPYIIYVKAPHFARLKETRHQAFARSTFDETSSRSFTVGYSKYIFQYIDANLKSIRQTLCHYFF